MTSLLVGMAGTLVALPTGSLGLYFAATVVACVGFGAGFLGVLRTLLRQAAAHQRAGLLSAVYVVSYLANSVPAVAAGELAGRIGLAPTARGYTYMVMALALFVLVGPVTRARAAVASE